MKTLSYHPPRLTLPEHWQQRRLRRKRLLSCLAWMDHFESVIAEIVSTQERDPTDAADALERLHHAEERRAFWAGRARELRR